MAGKVGFIGLGAMGGPMALNLAKAGHKLVVHDIDQSKTATVGAQGAELAGNAEAVAAAVDRTILIVETTDQVRLQNSLEIENRRHRALFAQAPAFMAVVPINQSSLEKNGWSPQIAIMSRPV